MRNQERSEQPINYTQSTTPIHNRRRISLPESRFFDSGLVRGGIITAAVVSGTAFAWDVSGRPNFVDFSNSIKVENPLSRCYDLLCEPIEGEEKKVFLTSPIPEEDRVIIRQLPILGNNQIGWAYGGQEVDAKAHYGVVYPSSGIDSHGLGKITGPDGNVYGKWFKVDEIWGFDNEGRPKIFKNYYVAGNFLKPPQEEDLSSLPAEN